MAFSIGAIAQSKITGLVTALGTKIDTIVNVGSGVGLIFRDKIGTTLNLKSLVAGTNVTITNNVSDIEISAGGGVVDGAENVGTGVDVFKQLDGNTLEFRRLLANLEILITQNIDDLSFSIGVIAQSKITGLITALGTKVDTIVNVGTGAGLVFRNKVGTTMNLKTILAGSNVTVTNNADDIEISAGGGIVKSGNDSVSVGGNTTVSFNTAFATVPNVVANLMDNVDHLDGEKGAVLSIYSVTVNGFTIRYDAPDSSESPADFDWIATDGGNP